MAIRDRIRKTFGKKESPSPTGSDTHTSTKPSEYHYTGPYSYTGRTDVEYYKPHEVPRSKYRGRVDPEHKDLLEAYSFTDAFSSAPRRASQALSGVMSPGGTKSQSRRTSCISRDSRSARNSVSSAAGPSKSAKVLDKQTAMTGMPPHMGLVRENSDDDTNLLNAGVSRPGNAKQEVVMTSDNSEVHSKQQAAPLGGAVEFSKKESSAYEQPFTAADLEKAMTQATITINGDGPVRNNLAIAAY